MKQFLLIIFCLSACLGVVRAAQPDPWDDYDEVAFMDMDLDENIATPRLQTNKEKTYVRNYMRGVAADLAKKKYVTELDRDNEVVVVTVPTDEIFLPNDTLLNPRSVKRLQPLLKYMEDPGMFKIVYVVHTDNTGSSAYNMDLSQQRLNTLYDWLLENVNEDLVIIPYAMGDTDPLEENNTRRGRAANRRLELYFVPGPELILKAR